VAIADSMATETDLFELPTTSVFTYVWFVSPYVSCVLRLTLLAPGIINARLDGRQPAEMTLAGLMRSFAVKWRERS
jgi:hypothetical protein